MRNLMRLLCVGFISIGLLVGCSDKDESSERIAQLESELLSAKKALLNKEKELEDSKAEISELKGEIVDIELTIPESFDDPKRVLNIVAMGINYERLTEGLIISDELEIEENLRVILEIVSKRYFKGHKMELSDIEEVDGKKIAVVNLAEDSEYWYNRMGGTTGGAITTYNLIQNILQRKYEGQWIDGVKFLVEGEPCEGRQHAEELSKTTYR